MPTIIIHNAETNEVLEREMTAAEIKQYEKDAAQVQALKNAESKRIADRIALLEKLGITEDEARLLLG